MINQSQDEVRVEFKGKEYRATYTIAKGKVEVASIYGVRSVQIGGLTAALAAHLAFWEILKEADANGVLDAY
ncbi:hypothetical protein [Pseudomonas sp. 2FE]|uniref:hypothetical protein n=1 Tax=Pseudomonas sp. 2FE TaxID=2502190 RepID=UPI0010F9B6C4|nr:hypothetical protein [Pseudomonas sp. 2FE]